MAKSKYDSIIFDMDGTLWDAVDSYCLVWDKTIGEFGVSRPPVKREQLIGLMGKTLDKIVPAVTPEVAGNEKFIERLGQNEREMMPLLGGRLYDGVREIMPQLSKTHKLLMVSNCSADGLPNFLHFTGLEPYITDTLSNGDNGLDKAANIKLISERNSVKVPLYIGDTQSDLNSCRKAGVDFAWASYGFGTADKPTYILSKFSDILNII